MNEAAIKKQLSELSESMTTSPLFGSEATDTVGVYKPEGRRGELSVAEAIERLRLQLKYLQFDLEATRRENRYLRQMLESRGRRDREEGNRQDH